MGCLRRWAYVSYSKKKTGFNVQKKKNKTGKGVEMTAEETKDNLSERREKGVEENGRDGRGKDGGGGDEGTQMISSEW